MKKFLTILGAFLLVFGLAVGAQATTINFDDLTASGQLIGEQYASLGVHFIDHPQGYGVDGYVTSGAAQSGSNYLQTNGNPTAGESGGVAIEFDNPVTSVSFYWKDDNGDTFGVWYGDWHNGDPAPVTGDLATATFGPVPSSWTQVNVAPSGDTFTLLLVGPPFGGNFQFDTMEFNMVPIPASVLLLGTGLIPLLRLRRKS